MLELPADTGRELDRLCALGDQHAEAEDFSSALAAYRAAWDLLPDPKEQWEAATWVLTAMGDANFQSGDFSAGRDTLSRAMRCPDALGNPFIHLRLGQCQFELGDLDRAADEFMRAYMGAGADVFREEDPKYLAFLGTRAENIDIPRKKSSWKFWQ